MKKSFLTITALILLLAVSFAQDKNPPLFPRIADTSHATKEQAALLYSFFTAKSRHDVEKTMAFFSKNMATYTDATLGWPLDSYQVLHGVFSQYMPQWPATGLSYPTRIIGGNGSVIIGFTDTPELFGGELRILGAVDFKDGKIVRWVDYWDSRSFNTELYDKIKTPKDKFPVAFKEAAVGENASQKIKSVCTQLQNAFSASNAQAAADLFSYDAVFEDMSLRMQLLGKAAIRNYLGKLLPKIVYGKDSKLRHITGNDLGGGFEWIASVVVPGLAGITAIELNDKGLITRLTTVYDSRMIDDKQFAEFAAIATSN